MKRILILLAGILLCLQQGHAQQKQTWTEGFDGSVPGWNTSPPGSWTSDAMYSLPNKSGVSIQSHWGFVPTRMGDTSEFLSPIYDCSDYEYVFLRFNHICKISPSDIARIEYREVVVLPGPWIPLSESVYQGKATNYSNGGFNSSSYYDWQGNDSTIMPTQSWWKEELFDLWFEAGHSRVQFRFFIKRGNVSGSNISYGWLVENFEVIASKSQIKLPTVAFATPFVRDTIYSTGPWDIYAKIKSNTNAALETPWLKWNINGQTSCDSVQMTEVGTGSSLWTASIPQFEAGTRVDYFITGRDATGNEATAYSGYVIKQSCENTSGDFSYTGSVQTVTLPPGTYQIEAWGADGGDGSGGNDLGDSKGGKGGYSKGTYTATNDVTLYIYVGGKGQSANSNTSSSPDGAGGWNGGGWGANGAENIYWKGGGGGGTDIRTTQNSTYSDRIIVAGGGGGAGGAANMALAGAGGNGGGLTGQDGIVGSSQGNTHNGKGGTQASGGDAATYIAGATAGAFGIGGNGATAADNSYPAGGGGGGWYGGGGGSAQGGSGGGGSGYIDGVTNGITVRIAETYFVANPDPDGNGYIRITPLSGGSNNIACLDNSVTLHSINTGSNVPTSSTAQTPIVVTIQNAGSLPLDSVSVGYTINGSLMKDTVIRFVPALPWDFTKKDTIGYYNFSMNGADVLTVWVKLPNGEKDSTTYDDTLSKTISGVADISAEFVTVPDGTVYSTGTHEILASIKSLTGKSISVVYLDVTDISRETTELNSHTLTMEPQGGDIWGVDIPNIMFNCDVTYTLRVTDYLNNSIQISGGYYIEYPGCGACLSNSVAADAILSPQERSNPGVTTPVKVRIRNKGTLPLTSCQINWSLNGVKQLSSDIVYTNSTGLTEDYTDTITIGEYPSATSGRNHIVVWVNLPNGVQDTLIEDDTLKITSTVCSPSMSVLTVGTGGNCAIISEAFDILRDCGVSNNITLELKGVFTENLDLTDLSFMNGYHLTITSAANHPDSAILQPSSGSVVTLGNIRDLTLNGITFNGKTVATHCVNIIGTCTNLVIRNCNLLSDTTTTSTAINVLNRGNLAGVDNFRMVGCLLDGGYYNVLFYGGTSNVNGSLGTNIVWDSNTFKSAYHSAISSYYTYFTSISHNIFLSRTANNLAYWYGINTNTSTHVEDIIGNRFRQRNTVSTAMTYIFGIYLNTANTTTLIPGRRPTMITNNEIIGNAMSTSSSSASYGIYLYNTGKASDPAINILHNSIYFSGTGYTYAIYTRVPTGQKNVIKNNNLYVTGSTSYPGYPIYLYTAFTTTLYDIDANNMYTAGAPNYVGYAGTARTSISDWQSIVTTDNNSTSVLASFINPANNLKLSIPSGLLCQGISDVNTDINNMPRGSTATMGCYELKSTEPFNASLIEMSDLRQGGILGETDQISVLVMNSGTTQSINSINLGWSVDGVVQGSSNYTVSLAPEQSTPLTVAITYLAGDVEVKVWINNINGISDDYQGDDTISKTTQICGQYSGIMNIGPNSTYKTIQDAYDAIDACGITGDITFAFETGTYTTNLDFTNNSTRFGDYKLTITSASGNREDVKFEPASGIVVTLGNTHNLTLEAMTFGRYAQVGNIVQLSGYCSNIEIRDCNLLSDTTATTTNNYIPLFKSVTDIVVGFRMVGCLLDGGYYNASFYGGSANLTGSLGYNIVWDSNTFRNAYHSGVFSYYTYFTSISHNTFLSRIANNQAYWYGINTNTGTHVEDIIGNRIIQRNTVTTAMTYIYGIYLNAANQTTVIPGRRPTMITNNEIIGDVTTTSYGIYLNNAGKSTDPPIYVLHNSIYFSGTGAARAIMTTVPTGQMNIIKNNMLHVTGGSAYAIYLNTAFNTTLYDIDANNMYAAGSPTYVGYAGGNRADITAWQGIVSTDKNSENIDPSYIDATASYKAHLKLNDYTNMTGSLNAQAILDIEGNMRTSTTSWGCYQDVSQSFATVDGMLMNLTGLKTKGGGVGQEEILTVELYNAGLQPITVATIRWTENGTPKADVPWSGNLASGEKAIITLDAFTYTSGTNTAEVILVLPTDTDPSNDTVRSTVSVCAILYSGTYNIPRDFNTYADFVTTINSCGASGNIILELKGTFASLDLSNNFNYMCGHHLTIKSADNHRDSVNFQPTSGVAVTLNNTYNLTLEGMTFGRYAAIGHIVSFTGPCSNIVIRNCNLLSDTIATTNNYYPINKVNSTGVIDNFRMVGCLLDGGYYNASFYGGSSNTIGGLGSNIVWDSNMFQNAYHSGIISYQTYFTSISHNTFLNRTANNTTTWYGINTSTGTHVEDIIGNYIRQRNTASTAINALYGIYLNSANITTIIPGRRPTMVTNNEIIGNAETTTVAYGIYLNNSGKATDPSINILHNSIYFSGAGRARAIMMTVPTGQMNIIKNNLLYVEGNTAYGIYLNTAFNTSLYDIDANNMYAPDASGYVGYAGGNRADIAAWQGIVSTDKNSVSVSPNFINPDENLKLADLNNLICDEVAAVTDDIEGTLRGGYVTMGCYEMITAKPSNATLVAMSGFRQGNIANQTDQLNVQVFNVGTSTTITSIDLEYSVNGISQGTSNHIISLSRGQTATLTAGIITYPSADATIKVWINRVNGVIDDYQGDDTLSQMVSICTGAYHGVMNIGPNQSIKTLEEAFNSLNLCGIDGNIIFAFEAGTYNSSLNLINNAALFGNHKLTITSTSGNRDEVIFQPTGAVNILMNNASNVTIENVTFNGRGTGTHCVNITGACTNVVIRNCKLLSDTTTTVTTVNVLNKATATGFIDNFRMVGCLLDGGYYNASFYGGISNANGGLGTNIVWDSNTFQNAYHSAILPYYTYFTSISYNTFLSRTTNNQDYWYGINTSTGTHVENIIGNRFRQRPTTGSTAMTYIYGVYLNAANQTTVIPGRRPTVIANNEIIGNATTANIAYGIYLNNTGKATDPSIYILHNSIYFSGTGQARAIQTTVPYGQMNVIKNNNLYVTGSVSYVAYPIYLNTVFNTALYDIDANNFYAAGSPNYVGYAGVPMLSMSNWQSVVTTDQNSVNVVPNFASLVNNSLELTNNKGLSGVPVTGITTDINGNTRSSLAPTMGAYEPAAARRDLMAYEIQSSEYEIIENQTVSVSLEVINLGTTAINNATFRWSINGQVQPNLITHNFTTPLAMYQQQNVPIGNYKVNGAIGDQISVLVWVESINAMPDERNWNDTTKVIYTIVPLARFVEPLVADTIYALSFDVNVKIVAGTGATITTPQLCIETIGKECLHAYDTLPMALINGNWVATVPNRYYYSKVIYTLYAEDTLGSPNTNSLTIIDSTYIDLLFSSDEVTKIFSYKGDIQTITLNKGLYQIEVWGADGGDGPDNGSGLGGNGGKGGYSEGTLSIVTPTTLYVVVGGKGQLDPVDKSLGGNGGFGGGGGGAGAPNNTMGGAGGGGLSGIFANSVTHANSVIIAGGGGGGGGGGYSRNSTMGGNGGGIFGEDGAHDLTSNGIYMGSLGTAGVGGGGTQFAGGILGAGGSGAQLGTDGGALFGGGATSSTYSGPGDPGNGITLAGGSGYKTRSGTMVLPGNGGSGGGGGGYYGGGGGGYQSYGGGGGAGYVDGVMNGITAQLTDPGFVANPDTSSGNGYIRITPVNNIESYNIGNNIAIIAVESPVSTDNESELCTDPSLPVKIALANLGQNDHDFTKDNITISYEIINPRQTVYTGSTTINTGNLVSGYIKSVELMPALSVMYSGNYEINAWITNGIDNFTCDDTIRSTYMSGRIALPVDEDFSNGVLPYKFISNPYKGDTRWEPYQPDPNYPVQPDFGTGMLYHTGSRGSMAQLLTRQLDLYGAVGSVMEFWYYHDTATTDKSYVDVSVIADGNTISEKIIYKKTGSLHGWTQYTVDLDPYTANQCVLIMFESMVGSSGETQYIDRIYIYGPQNLGLDAILVPSLTACTSKNREVQLAYANTSSLLMDFVTTPTRIHWEVSKNAMIVDSGVYVLNSGDLDKYAADTITLATMDFDTGTYHLTAWIVDAIDHNSLDDTVRKTIIMNPALSVTMQAISGGTTSCLLTGQQVQQTVRVENTGNMDIPAIELLLNIGGSSPQVIRKSLFVNLLPGDILDTTFTYTVPADVNYYTEVIAYMSCDSAMANHNAFVWECVDLDDLSLSELIKPQSGVSDIVGELNEIEVSIMNASDVTTYDNVVIIAQIEDENGVQVISEIREVVPQIEPLRNVPYTFKEKYTVPDLGVYYIRIFIDSRDNYPTNDTLLERRETSTGLSMKKFDTFTLEQNIPNPADNSTIIKYSIPESGEVIFRIHSMNGQILYNKVIDSESGDQNIEIITLGLSSGVYTYSMEYKGQRIVKRMSIKR